MTEFTFKLENSVKYQRDGENLNAQELVLSAPSYKQRTNCQELKQLFYKAVKPIIQEEENSKKIEMEKARERGSDAARKLSESRKMDEENKEDGKKDLKADQFMPLFLQSNVNMEHLSSVFEKLLTSGICLIDGIPITKTMLQDISLSDFERLFGEYMFHFLV